MWWRALAFAACAVAGLIAPARAQDIWGEDVQVMDDNEMSDLRGGFAVQGIDINFGAVITTYVNGVPVLSTNLTWTDVGAMVDQTIGDAGENIADMTPAQRAALGIGDLGGAGGVVIADASGVTALIQNVANGSLQNIVINGATGRDISQNVDVTLTLPGFETIQNSLQVDQMALRINEDMTAAMLAPHL